MGARHVLHIIPKLPRPFDGIADHALLLAARLKQQSNIQSTFLCAEHDPTATRIGEFPLMTLPSQSANTLKEMLRSLDEVVDLIACHYVGFGYAKKGVPFWLLNGLRQSRSRNAPVLLSIFHEFAASGPLWSSSFWTAPAQRNLCVSLASLSDHCVYISTLGHRLQRRMAAIPGSRTTLAGFSTIGEIQDPLPLGSRRRQAIIFGTAGRRAPLYTRHLKELRDALRHFQIERIIDIGGPLAHPPAGLDIPVEFRGNLPADQVSSISACSYLSIIEYPPAVLEKSSIYMAAASHGSLPLVFSTNPDRGSKVFHQVPHVLSTVGHPLPDDVQAQEIASAAFHQYRSHSVEAHARIYLQLLDETDSKSDACTGL